MKWGFFAFKREQNYLQNDTKFIVICFVLPEIFYFKQKINTISVTAPSYLTYLFINCDLMLLLHFQSTHNLLLIPLLLYFDRSCYLYSRMRSHCFLHIGWLVQNCSLHFICRLKICCFCHVACWMHWWCLRHVGCWMHWWRLCHIGCWMQWWCLRHISCWMHQWEFHHIDC